MKRIFISVFVIALLLGFSMQAHAVLQNLGTDSLGNRLIYDTDLDITWYDYTNAGDSWSNQVAWASSLSVTFGTITYTDWRLPAVIDIGGDGCNFSYIGTDCGFNVDTSTGEMAHLWYDELGNLAYYDTSGSGPQSGWGLANTGDFQNLLASYYYSGTEYTAGLSPAWGFSTNNGYQSSVSGNTYAIAVLPGLAVAPEPLSMVLFGAGGVVLAVRRKLRSHQHR